MYQEISSKVSQQVRFRNHQKALKVNEHSFSEINKLKNLEMLNFERNFLMEIPIELTECTAMIQMSFDECSRLFSIPKNLLMMPNLRNVSFKNCSLLTLPMIASGKLENLLFSGNQLLNCIPYDLVKFLELEIRTSEFYKVAEEELGMMLEAQ